MTTVVVGCDKNQSNDAQVQNTIVSALKKQGNEVEKLTIGPGYFANYDWGKSGNPKGKIGVYIIADGLTSISDRFDNPSGFKYVYFVVRGDLGRAKMDSRKDFENNPIGKDHEGDCTAKSCAKLVGKTFPQINEIVKSKCYVVFGTTADEMANELIKAMGGDTDSSSDDKGSGGSAGNVKECIQELLKHWDGDVECRIIDDDVYISKVRDPEKYHSCELTEGVNVLLGNTTVTDLNPETPNHLVVDWTGGTIDFTDEKLIFRFGEKVKHITAVKKVVQTVTVPASDNSGDDTSTDGTDETTASDANGTDTTS